LEGKFHIFVLASEFPFSEEAANAATISLAQLNSNISRETISIGASIVHELAHYLYFTSHPACIFVNTLEHHVYSQKLAIVAQYGSGHYAAERKEFYVNTEITNPGLYAEYKILEHFGAVRDLLINFGRFPVQRIRLFNEITNKKKLETVQLGEDSFIPSIRLPTEPEFEITKSGPTLEDIVEALAVVEELKYLDGMANVYGSLATGLSSELRTQYGSSSRYSTALKFVRASGNLSEDSALSVLLLILSLCGPCLGERRKTSWTEFHPTNRLCAMIGVLDQLPPIYKTLSLASPELVEALFDVDRRLGTLLSWRTAAQNVGNVLQEIESLCARSDINLIPVMRMRDNLREKSNNLLFPHRVIGQAVLQPPVSIFKESIGLYPASREEGKQALTYLRIVALQFVMRYLISNNRTTDADTAEARKIYNFVRKRFEQLKIERLEQEFPSSYDKFIDQMIFRSRLAF
jgi:hypothetical protein